MKIPPLDQRIEYLLSVSVPFDPGCFNNVSIRSAIDAIGASGFSIRQDNYPDQEASKQGGKLGLCVFSEKHPPLIYLVLSLHDDDSELADTIFHEALHATAKPLGRHVVLPEDPQLAETHLEELAVYSGLSRIYPLLGIPQMREIHRRNKARHATLEKALASGLPKSEILTWNQYGVEAADYLLNIIKR
ncbi:hypothetical protein [Paracoccus aminovorans]|uniref:hypothetical protein n=1 Tax=Paracoccus aminovorans TaxID=34004 RepID=UPI002B25ED9D|nr:hypothetical protein [Paracoccus aminovorans]